MYKTVNPGLHSEAGALMPLFELFWTYYIVNTRRGKEAVAGTMAASSQEERGECKEKRIENGFLVCSERKRKENRFFLSLHKVHSNPNVVALM
jgi:hypothetical protein